jgi:hypothetical protein
MWRLKFTFGIMSENISYDIEENKYIPNDLYIINH